MASPCFSFPEMTWIIPLRLCSMIPWNSLPVTPCAENLWQLSSTQVLRSNSPFAVKWISSHISLKYPKVAKKKRWSFKGNFSSLNKYVSSIIYFSVLMLWETFLRCCYYNGRFLASKIFRIYDSLSLQLWVENSASHT